MDFKHLTRFNDAISAMNSLNFVRRQKSIELQDCVWKFAFDDALSPSTFPPSNRSAVDGFALKFEDVISSSRGNPCPLKVVGRLDASTVPDFVVRERECAQVFTGSTIPEGCDAVIMQEDADIINDIVYAYRPLRKYQNIMLAGEDLNKGDIILRAGKRILPWHYAALIETGIKKVNVHDESIAIISTGNELVSGKVKNSTAPMLSQLISRSGLASNFYGNVEDDKSRIRDVLNSVKEDVIITTGGSGPGSVDLVHSVVEDNGKIIFHGLRIKPGRTTGLGVFNGKPVFMISGLPVAALVAYDNIIEPGIRAWFGIEDRRIREVTGTITRSVYNNEAMKMFVRVKLIPRDGKLYADPLRTTGSGVVSSVLNADGYLVIDDDLEGYRDGDEVQVNLLE